MANTNKDFNYEKACCLFYSYTKKRQKEKAKLIYELLDRYESFKPKSIIGCELMLSKFYEIKTIESVLSDLGYSLIKSEIKTYRSNWGMPIMVCNIISFDNV